MLNLQQLPPTFRGEILHAIANHLRSKSDFIVAENEKDVKAAIDSDLDINLRNRLQLTPAKIETIAKGIVQIAEQTDPLNRILRKTELSPGLILEQRTSPLGVLLVIFESRPDALPQIAALSILAGDGVILKGGREAVHSNTILSNLIQEAIRDASSALQKRLEAEGNTTAKELCNGLGSIVSHVTTRADINSLLALDNCIDLVIPRGSASLVSSVRKNTKIPVMGHSEGVCHIYIHPSASREKAIQIAVDAKTDYPAACNAMETLLIDREALQTGVAVCQALKNANVVMRAGPNTEKVPEIMNFCTDTTGPDMHIEYGNLTLTVQVVDGIGEAVAHVHRFGSGHTESIVAEDKNACDVWKKAVDSACVFVNASTRFADGFRFGLGAEVGISTSKIHARGPVGADGLTTTKWILVSTPTESNEKEDKLQKAHTVGAFNDNTFQYTHKSLEF